MIVRAVAIVLAGVLCLSTTSSLDGSAAEPIVDASAPMVADNPRKDRRDDRQEERPEQRDDRQECRQEEGRVGKDKRDCKREDEDDDDPDGVLA